MDEIKEMSPEGRPYVIYALIDPVTQMVRYIGQTVNAHHRLNKHLYESRRKRTHRECWISGLLDRGERPVMEIIETVNASNVDFWEEHYIHLYLSWGFDLTNICRDVTQYRGALSTRKLQSESKLKAWGNNDYRQKQQSAIREGVNKTIDQTRIIWSENAKNNLHNPENSEKRKKAIREALLRPEYRKKRSIISQSMWDSKTASERQEVFAKMRCHEDKRKAASKAAVQSVEYREKQSGIIRNRWKRPFIIMDKGGNEVGVWENIIVASQDLGICSSGISAVLRGVAKTVGGYKAEFIKQ